ncbi:sulfotransferase domain-containing protein [Ruegeria profundi]|uniref:sulfotransferase domain-containing protein n=1 Tax=Ruegeria profundi TaxID=1685378 RepID=UPI001CD2FC87|nr:sulfotransferase domain-containing protein [Ruegeria profundi]MCA0929710.1 sulfotransferase domain-containing protein [Ruegeria profundi]
MSQRFDYFIILAAMRTGSNLLEFNLNALDGVTCHGEAFNPHFIGRLKSENLLGVTLEDRDADPMKLVRAIKDAPGKLNGFRFFQGHDPRVLESALTDPRCAKIILTRNPLDSYISLKIARETKQWQLKNIKRRREAKVEFDAQEFQAYLNQQQAFQAQTLNTLQRTGQSGFYITYDDLTDLDVLNGLADWLGVSARLSAIDDTIKPQNPEPPLSKVTNPEETERALIRIDSFNLFRTPNFEPRQAPDVSNYVAAIDTPLMYMPLRGGLAQPVIQWLADLDAVDVDNLISNQSQKEMQQWLLANRGHRKFTVLQHPLARAHFTFCSSVLSTGPGTDLQRRNQLRNRFKIPIPGQLRDGNYPVDQHYDAFAAFLAFLRHNLAGQTPVPVDAMWCSQSQALAGMASFASPDLILREDEIATALPDLARRMGHENPPEPNPVAADVPFLLADIYDDKLEALATEAYQRDYMQFGFENWKPTTRAA